MSPDELEKRQKALQEEGREVLKKLQIIPFLSKFGNPNIVGSFTLGLMTWQDIDIELVKPINEEEYWQTVHYIFRQSNLKGTFIMDYRKSVNPNTPKGLYICVQYYGKQKDPWKIDIWFIPPREPNQENLNEWIKNNLKGEHRIPILEIKNAISSNPKYRKQIFSVDIYKAVIEKNIRDLEGFKNYLKETGRILD